jgi:aminomethyltransferase
MTSTTDLLKTPLHAWHAEHGGRLVDFAGWSMPVQYTSIMQEHVACRTAVGLFDVSHMGRFYFADPAACGFLNTLTTRRVHPMDTGRIRYSLMTREDGGVLDDVLVYHLQDAAGKAFCFMVVNASNREKIHGWLAEHGDLEKLGFEDRTTQTAMIAVQGPRALEIVNPLCDTAPGALKYYHGMVAEICGTEAIVSRTGYTGEDGCELTVPADKAEEIWSTILEKAAAIGGSAVGLAARDTLRLEAAMPLYGHELNEDINPAQADVNFAINLKDRDFPGRAAIVAAKSDPALPRRVGLEMDGKRPAREHSRIFVDDQPVGEVTSGTFSPTLQKPIAMGYVKPEYTESGTAVEIEIRGKRLPASVCPLPFYSRD